MTPQQSFKLTLICEPNLVSVYADSECRARWMHDSGVVPATFTAFGHTLKLEVQLNGTVVSSARIADVAGGDVLLEHAAKPNALNRLTLPKRSRFLG